MLTIAKGEKTWVLLLAEREPVGAPVGEFAATYDLGQRWDCTRNLVEPASSTSRTVTQAGH